MTLIEPELDGWLSDKEFTELRRLATSRTVLEIGSWKGRSTIALVETAKHVVAIDHFAGDGYTNKAPPDLLQQFVTNLDARGLRDKVTLIVGDMRNILPALRASEFDLIFYDAEHSGESTRFALNWAAGVKRSAVVAVHDYNHGYEHYREAAEAIDEFAKNMGRKIRLVNVLAILDPVECDEGLGS